MFLAILPWTRQIFVNLLGNSTPLTIKPALWRGLLLWLLLVLHLLGVAMMVRTIGNVVVNEADSMLDSMVVRLVNVVAKLLKVARARDAFVVTMAEIGNAAVAMTVVAEIADELLAEPSLIGMPMKAFVPRFCFNPRPTLPSWAGMWRSRLRCLQAYPAYAVRETRFQSCFYALDVTQLVTLVPITYLWWIKGLLGPAVIDLMLSTWVYLSVLGIFLHGACLCHWQVLRQTRCSCALVVIVARYCGR